MSDLGQALAALKQRDKALMYTAFGPTGPHRAELYPEHMKVIEATKTHRIIVATGGNRAGKSYLAKYICSNFLTGDYREDWKGRRYNRPLTIWVLSNTMEQARDIYDHGLFGSDFDDKPFFIPPSFICGAPERQAKPKMRIKIPVMNVACNAKCSLSIHSYEKGVGALQSRQVDIIIVDEIPEKYEIIDELKARITSVDGLDDTLLFFIGTSGKKVPPKFTEEFFIEDNPEIARFCLDTETVPHISEKERAGLRTKYKDEMVYLTRVKGLPWLGESRVFDKIPVIPPPHDEPLPHWLCTNGYDEGMHAGFVFWAFDPDERKIHIYDSFQLESYTLKDTMRVMHEKSSAPYWCDTSLKKDDPNDRRAYYRKFVAKGFDIRFPNKKRKETSIAELRIGFDNEEIVIWDTPNNKKLIQQLQMLARDEEHRIIKGNDHCSDALWFSIQANPYEGKRYDQATKRKKHEIPAHHNLYLDYLYQPWYDNEDDQRFNGDNLSW